MNMTGWNRAFVHVVACRAAALAAACAGLFARAEADIPVLSWTERSNWTNVKTDVTPAAVGDGVADDTAALQAALNLFTYTAGGAKVVYLPAGTYCITNTLTWPSSVGCTLIGHGRDTRILWNGAPNKTMLRSDGAARCNVIGLVWDGGDLTNNIRGFLHNAASRFESSNRHQHEAFLHLSVGIQGTYGDMGGGTLATSEMLIDNCLFSDCGTGINFANSWNYYNEAITRCEFRDCGTGVRFGAGYGYVRFCHFERSTVGDIQGAARCSARFCTSMGSATFYNPNELTQAVVQDCVVSAYTSSLAIRGGDGSLIVNTVFSNLPPGSVPIYLGTDKAIVCNNTRQGEGAVYTNATGFKQLAAGAVVSLGLTPERSFLEQAVTVPSVVFDAKADFNALAGGDDTAKVQACIDAARNAGNGAMAYFPNGQYRIAGTILVGGSNYVISGNGYYTEWKWTPASTGTMMSVTEPNNVRVEYLSFPSYLMPTGCTAIRQTSTGGLSSVTYDRLLFSDGPNSYTNARLREGLHLVNLPTGAVVRMGQIYGTVRLSDCGQATVLGDLMDTSGELIEGAVLPKTGFLGFGSRNGLNLQVGDNNDIVVGDCNMEQSSPWGQPAVRGVRLSGGTRSGSGRVTIGAIKINLFDSPTIVEADNYEGNFTFLHANVAAGFSFVQSLHTGTRPLSAVYGVNQFPNAVHQVERAGTNVALANIRNTYGYPVPSEWYGQGAGWVTSSLSRSMSGPWHALRFDGSNDAVLGPKNLPVSTSVTVMAWVRISALTNGTVVSWQSPETNAVKSEYYSLQVNAAGQALFLVRSDLTPNPAFCATGSTVLAAGGWHHLAGIWDGAQASVAVDGIRETAVSAVFTNVGAGSGSHMNRLHMGGAPGRCFSGDLDEARVYNVALSIGDVAAAYAGGSGTYGASNEAGLVAGYHFDEGADRNAFDYQGSDHGLLHQFGVDSTPTGAEAVLSGAVDHLRLLGRTLLAVEIQPYQSLLTVAGESGGTAAGGGLFSLGSLQPITATPAWDRDFAGWSGTGIADTNSLSTTVLMDGPKTVTAHFQPKANPGCLLTLVASPSDGGTVTGGGVCLTNSLQPIAAIPTERYIFKSWQGAGVTDTNNASTTVLMVSTKTVTAMFMQPESNGTWNGTSGGNAGPAETGQQWSDTNKWTGGIVAGTVGATAGLGTLFMNSQGYYTITLNDNYNISNAYHNVGSHRHAIVQTNGTSVLSLTGGGSVTGNGAVHYYTPIRLEGGSGSSYAFREPNLSIYGTVSGTAGAGGNYDLILAGGGTVATPGAPNASYVGSLADGAGGGTLSIVKTETGIWTLSNSNSFSGATTVRNGRLKFGHVHAFGTGNMPIVLGDSGTGAGDTLDLEHANNNTMTRNIVINNSNPSGASILSVRNSLGTPVFSGQVNLNRAVTVHTEGGGYPTFSGKITGSGGLVKTGPDRVTLSGNENDYQGGTTMNAGLFIASGTGALGSGPAAVYGGVLRANQGVGLPVNVPLMLNGGVWESSAAITRSLGSGAGQLQLSNYAGFSASGAISVNINGGAGLAWGSTAGFNPTTLVLNETTAAAQLTFQNALDLNGADRIIAVNANTAIISNSLGNTSGTAGLVKTGAGTLILAGSNSFNGGLTVNAGALIIRSNNTYTGTTRVNGSTLTLDYTNRNTGVVLVPGATPLVLSNGVFSVNGSGMAGQSTLQTVSGLTLVAGANTVSVAAHGSRPAVLNLGAIARSLSSSCTANFILPGGTQDAANGITTSSGAANTRLGWWATVNGSEWAAKDADNDNIVAWSAVGGTYVDVTRLSSGTKRIVSNPVSDIRIIDGTGTAGNITNAAAGTTDIATLFAAVTGGTATYDPGSTDVLRLSATGSVVLTGAAGSGALTLGAITNDGVLTAGGAANTAGLLTFCNNHGANLITINASIANNGTGIVGLEKTGPGTVVLTANNYPFTGTNTILAGALEYQFPSTVAPTVIGGGVLLNGGTLRYQETGGNAGATLKDSVTVGAGGGAIDFRALASGGGQFTPVMVGTIVLGGNLTLQSLGNTHACVSGVTLSNLAFTVNSPVIYNDVVNTDSPNGAKVMLPASLAAPTRTLNLAGTVPLPAGQLTKFQINGATSNSLNLANLAMGAGSSLYLISGSTTNPLSQIKANGGSLIMGSGSSLTLQGTVSTPGPVFDPAAVTWQGENSLVFERDPTGNRDSWMQIVDNLTVSTAGGLVQLTAIPWRQSLTIAAGKTLTIGAGGTLVWTVGSQVNEFINGNIALLDGSVVTPSYSIAANNQGGLIRGTTGTLTLGDGSGTTSTPSVVTVRGDQAGYLNTFKIGYVTNTVESGVVKMKYASTSSAAGSAFVVGWSAAGTYSANLAAFRETRGGTEFAPQAGGGGVAVVGAASGPVALFSNMVTVSTGGTVGFYNAGANNTRGSLGAVVVTNGGSLAFTTNGLIQASNVVFRSGATLRVALTSAATNGCSLVFASGPLTFEGNTEIAISEGFGLTACRGPWYVARGAMLSGLPRKTSSLYSVTVEGGALRIDRASPGTLITIR